MQILNAPLKWAAISFVALLTGVFAPWASAQTEANCTGTNKVFRNGNCINISTVTPARPNFTPQAVTNSEGVVLYPRAMANNCANGGFNDSNCTVLYSYGNTALPPAISISFTAPGPLTAGSGTSQLQWSTSNAVSTTLSCTGVAYTVSGLSVATSASPYSGVTFSSSVVGTQTCTITATNPFGITAAASAMLSFISTPPVARPTISIVWNPNPLKVGVPYSLTWTTTNTTTLTSYCTTTGTGWGNAVGTGVPTTQPLTSGSSTNSTGASAAWVGYPTTCLWTATGPGGVTTYTEVVATVAPVIPRPTISVTRINGLPMQYPGTTGSTWSSTNATTVTVICTSADGGYTSPLTQMGVSGTGGGATQYSWVGKTSVCTWTATGPGGTAVFTETLTTNGAVRTTVWRMNGGGFYYYTANTPLRDLLVTTYGWTNEGAAFSVYLTAGAGLLPVNQYYNVNGSRFWTNDPAEIAQAPTWVGNSLEIAAVWYAQLNNAANGATPLYRFYISASDSYFYTASYAEYLWVLANIPSWSPDGASQYVWP
jgi:hypothetical protein